MQKYGIPTQEVRPEVLKSMFQMKTMQPADINLLFTMMERRSLISKIFDPQSFPIFAHGNK